MRSRAFSTLRAPWARPSSTHRARSSRAWAGRARRKFSEPTSPYGWEGSLVDADIEFVSGGAAPNYLMYLDDLHGSPAVGTNTTILGTDGSTDTIAGGIDLSSYTITGYFLRSAHFSVD